MQIHDANARGIEVELGSTVELMRTNPRLAKVTGPANLGSHDAETWREAKLGEVVKTQVVVTQTRRADGVLCDPSFSFRVNDEHQFGGFARHLPDDGWPNVGFLVYDDGSGFEVTRYVIGCPGCANPIEVSAKPTPETWLDVEQWCPDCRGVSHG